MSLLRPIRGVALALLCVLAACSDDAAPVVEETTLVTDTDDPAGPYEISTIVRDDTGVSGAWIFFSTDGKNTFDSVAMASAGVQAWRGRLRGFPLGTRVDYYVAARDQSANVGTDPSPAPASTYCFLVGRMPSHPRILLVAPTSGPTTGGTPLSIYGQDFRPGARVLVEGSDATQVTVVDETLITALTPPGAAGRADVSVENPAAAGPDGSPCRRVGDSAPVRVTSPDAFLYIEPPTPREVVPGRGPTAGGTTVTIRGTGFEAGAVVTFDGVTARDCTTLSPTEIRCVTPPGDPGPADVAVANPDGYAGTLPAGYVFVPPPEIFTIEPPRGPDTGATAVTVRGRGFDAGAIVLFDDVDQDQIVVVDGGTITAVTKPHAVGFVDVRVRNGDGQEARLSRGFFYYGPPIITSIVPAIGPTSGGQRVVISGSSFVPGLTVTFDGLSARLISVTESELIVETPPHPEGSVAVVVTNPDLRSARTAYRYVPAPDISSVQPTCGPATGGTQITIQGLNFQMGAVALFGDVEGPTQFSSPAVLTATTPAHAGGDIEVRVRNPDGGLSLTAGHFSFVPAPTVSAVSPSPMGLCGSEALTIHGANFRAGARVTIGGQACAGVQVVAADTITCTAPSLAAGDQPIVVTNTECLEQASTGAVTLRYEPLSIAPTGGLIAGFTNVRVVQPRGGQRRVAAVRFGGQSALDIQVVRGATLAQSPPAPVGAVPVEVTLEGCPAETAAQRFAYRVLVDQTAQRLPAIACGGVGQTCQASHLKFGDLNGDGLAELVAASGGIAPETQMTNVVYYNDPNNPGFFRPQLLTRPDGRGQNASRVDIGDANGDGAPELLFANDSSGGELWANDGRGNFSVPTTGALGAFARTLAGLGAAFDAQFVDVNNDGRKDVVYLEIGVSEDIGVPRNGPDHVFLNNGGGAFGEVAGAFPSDIFSVHDHKMGFGRFNDDAFLDMAVVVDSHFLPRPFNRLLFGDGQGHFRSVSSPPLESLFGDVFGIEVADFDGDGRDDIFLPVEGRVVRSGGCQYVIQGQPNVLLMNDGTGRFVDRSDLLPANNDATIGAAQVDIDGDGDIDLIAINFGMPVRILVNEGNGRFHDASDALREPPICSLSASGAAIDRTGIPALAIGGNFETRLWIQTATP